MAPGAAAGPLWVTMLAGAVTGLLPRFLLHPLDTCKTRLQASSPTAVTAQYESLWDAGESIWKLEGLAGFYRGLVMSLVGSIPGMCLYFTTYALASSALEALGPFGSLLAGFFAEAFSCLAWVPADVVKERLQIQNSYEVGGYKGSWDALVTILRLEGLTGLYKGYGSTLLVWGPYSGILFAIYESLRVPDDVMPFGERVLLNALSGAFAGAVAAVLTTPLDLLKIRLQIDRRLLSPDVEAVEYTYHYTGLADSAKRVVREEGACGLWKGAFARALVCGLFTAASFATFEALSAWLESR